MDIRHPSRRRAHTPGFTLLELMITLALAAILLTLGVPAFAQLMASTRITAAVNELNAAIRLIRSEAVKRSYRTALCPSGDGVSCTDLPVWEQGWIAFVDTDADQVPDAGEEILHVHDEFPEQISIRSGSRTRIVFRPSGIALGGLTGTYTVCDASDAAPPKALILSNSGRIRVSLTRPDGDPLECPQRPPPALLE